MMRFLGLDFWFANVASPSGSATRAFLEEGSAGLVAYDQCVLLPFGVSWRSGCKERVPETRS